jgi:hypothetical protein
LARNGEIDMQLRPAPTVALEHGFGQHPNKDGRLFPERGVQPFFFARKTEFAGRQPKPSP